MRVHALEILLAPDLVDMVSGASDDLLARVRALRRKIAMELGVVVPPVRTRDSIDLPAATYVIRIAGVEAGRGTGAVGQGAGARATTLDSLPGIATVEPVFGLAGKWVPAETAAQRRDDRRDGDRPGLGARHAPVLDHHRQRRPAAHPGGRAGAHRGRQAARTRPAVDELIPGLLSLAEVQRVLQGLLVEQIPINDLPRIYEALTLRAKVSTEPEGLDRGGPAGARAGAGGEVPGRVGAAGHHDRPDAGAVHAGGLAPVASRARRSCWTEPAGGDSRLAGRNR